MTEDRGRLDHPLKPVMQALGARDVCELVSLAKHFAESGQAECYTLLGSLYESGDLPDGVQLDLAFSWYSKGAFEGDCAESYFALGRFYFHGIHVSKDLERAVDFFEAAARKGSLEASVVSGFCYLHGLGVQRNLPQARLFLLPAHRAGYVIGTALLSKLEFSERKFFRGVLLYARSLVSGVKLFLNDPQDPKLFWLKSAE